MLDLKADLDWFYANNPDVLLQEELHKQDLTFDDFSYIKNIIGTKVGMFQYSGIDDLIESRRLELLLLFSPNICFFKNSSLGLVLCHFTVAGNVDIEDNIKQVKLTTINNKEIPGIYKYEYIVPIRDNALNIPPIISIIKYIKYIKYLEDDMMQVIDNATLPLVIIGSKENQAQFKAISDKMKDKKQHYIYGDKTLAGSIQSFSLNSNVKPEDIWTIRQHYIDECLNSIGVYTGENKRERLITSEIQNDNDYVDFIYQDCLNQRQKAISKCNDKFGTDYRVIESYEINFNKSVQEQQEMQKGIAKGQAEGNPNSKPTGQPKGQIK